MRSKRLFKSKYKYSLGSSRYKKRGIWKKILIVLLILVILAGIAALGYFAKIELDKKNENKFAKYGEPNYNMPDVKMFYPNTPDDKQAEMIKRTDEYYEKQIAEGKIYVPDETEAKNIYVKDGIKTCYLTFDDGPSMITDGILDTLKKHDIKATFFVIGELTQYYPDTIRRMHNEGHTIGNHSYSHNYSAIYKDAESFETELMMVKESLNKILGFEYEKRIFRFPGGSFEQGKQEFKQTLADKGYKYIDWNSLTGDSEVKEPDYDYLYNNLVTTTNGKEDIVVLMHDAGLKTTTAESLDSFIEYLKNEGFVFKPIN